MHFKTELKRDSAQKGAFQMGFKRMHRFILHGFLLKTDVFEKSFLSVSFRQLISVITAVTM
jgi:hypothetical protein